MFEIAFNSNRKYKNKIKCSWIRAFGGKEQSVGMNCSD